MSTNLLLEDTTTDLAELDLDIQISETEGEGPAFASGGYTSPSTYGSPCNLCCW
ncbi:MULTISPECIES: class II lantibiotic LanA [Streptomyces]|uniref:Class II lantibiotic LanA n=1 Tax=Streptomyces smyrnaeus TaxID=1387713 RepID=A0ABS3XZM0_9ACTN|nr:MULTISPECIES: class II lantibiotic LanA [Streptomyces]MBQ1160642.1 class II lantibiotic LanA [Streptomyces sp. A73]MBO8200865.1 class II lantibiotic LanA [Streptomyces smyrnaeus]MBQ0866988.1 class II lantibiotic LanA [Streptomyces sp. RK75]MBQ1119870.1 class II lantibiotic LanA [Streptomyces sp. B15]UNZ21242.1 class II lantibiotic LanA [Streptomyces sp. 891-h]